MMEGEPVFAALFPLLLLSDHEAPAEVRSLASNQSLSPLIFEISVLIACRSKSGFSAVTETVTTLLGEVPDKLEAVSVILWSPHSSGVPRDRTSGWIDGQTGWQSGWRKIQSGCSVPGPGSECRQMPQHRWPRYQWWRVTPMFRKRVMVSGAELVCNVDKTMCPV